MIAKLITHLQANWKRYVLPESGNRTTMTLHRYANLWIAFEQSAYFLYHACPASILMVTRVEGNPFPLLVGFVPDDLLALDPALTQHVAGDDNCCQYTSRIPLTDYPEWRSRKIREHQRFAPTASYFDIRLTAHGAISALGLSRQA